MNSNSNFHYTLHVTHDIYVNKIIDLF